MTGLGLIGFSLVLIAGSGIRTDWVHHPIAATSSIAGSTSAAEEPSDLVEVGTRAGSAAGSNSGNDGVTGGAGTCGSQRDCSCGGSGPPCTRLSDEPLGMDLAVAEAEKDAADVVRILPLASCVRRKVLNVTKFRVTKFSIIKYRLQLYELYPDTSVHVVQLY